MAPLDSVKMPPRIAALPRDERGFPVPWFVEWRGGRPLFPVMSTERWKRAVRNRLCWVCGQPLGRMLHFVIGPMCTINRITAEPATHQVCAEYALMVCPYLANPRMRRVPLERYADDQELSVAGFSEPGNPGIAVDWTCRQFSILPTATGPLIELGEPVGPLGWWREGRQATAEEAAEAFAQGAARLRRRALVLDGEAALPTLERLTEQARALLP